MIQASEQVSLGWGEKEKTKQAAKGQGLETLEPGMRCDATRGGI
jgi:hypothetical protein